VIEWIAVKDEIPPIVESFKDGTNFHGEVLGWFAYFYKENVRKTVLWTSDSTKPRWMVQAGSGYGASKEPPTHWMPLLPAPK
jgi:hypothetical protein